MPSAPWARPRNSTWCCARRNIEDEFDPAKAAAKDKEDKEKE